MDKYIKQDDVIAVLNKEGYTKNMRIHKKILAIPPDNVRHVVQCKNCLWWKRFNPSDGHGAEPCNRTCGFFNQGTEGEDYCSYGLDMNEEN